MFVVLKLTPNINTETEFCHQTAGKLEHNYPTTVGPTDINQYVLTNDTENQVMLLPGAGGEFLVHYLALAVRYSWCLFTKLPQMRAAKLRGISVLYPHSQLLLCDEVPHQKPRIIMSPELTQAGCPSARIL